MKDITITSKRIKLEIKTLLVCFALSFLSNIGAIIYYKSPAVETITSLPYVILFAGFIYVAWSFLRGLFALLSKIRK
jgi:hypothetical protein